MHEYLKYLGIYSIQMNDLCGHIVGTTDKIIFEYGCNDVGDIGSAGSF